MDFPKARGNPSLSDQEELMAASCYCYYREGNGPREGQGLAHNHTGVRRAPWLVLVSLN